MIESQSIMFDLDKYLGKDISEIDDSFGYWFSGFVDGEGSFLANVYRIANNTRKQLKVSFKLFMRADDYPILLHIKNTLGVGRIGINEIEHKNPMAGYAITRRSELRKTIVPLFDKYPLRSRKLKDYEIWRNIVIGIDLIPRGNTRADGEWKRIEKLVRLLKNGRKYQNYEKLI